MKRLSENALSVAVIALAASVVSVGVVWAGTSALRGGDTVSNGQSEAVGSTAPGGAESDGESPGDGDLPQVPPDDITDIAELTALVENLGEQVDALARTVATSSDKVNALEKKIATVSGDFDGLESRLSEGLRSIENVGDDVAQAKQDAADALARVGGLSSAVSVLERKASKLAEDGNYSGPVNPSQLTRRLTAADISGNWPLNRVSEKLRTEHLEVTGFGCTSDFRYHTVMVVNTFRSLECVRIAK